LGIMNNPIFFAQSGYVIGTLFTCFISYLVAYNMALYSDVIQYLEDKHPKAKIDQMEDCIGYLIQHKTKAKVLYVSKLNKSVRFQFFLWIMPSHWSTLPILPDFYI
jgi:hypothetical protein